MRLNEQFKKRLQKLAGLKNLQEQDRRRKPNPKSAPKMTSMSNEDCLEYYVGEFNMNTTGVNVVADASIALYCNFCNSESTYNNLVVMGLEDGCICCPGESGEEDYEEPDTSSQPLSSNYACTPCGGCQPSDDGPFSSLEECEGTCSETNIDTFFDDCPGSQCGGFNTKEEFCNRCEVEYSMTQDWASQNNLPNCDCCDNVEPQDCPSYYGDEYDGVFFEDNLEFCASMWGYSTNVGCYQFSEAFCEWSSEGGQGGTSNCPNTPSFATQESCCNYINVVLDFGSGDIENWEEFCG